MENLISKFRFIEPNIKVVPGNYGPELFYDPRPHVLLKLRNVKLEIEVCDGCISNISSEGFTGKRLKAYIYSLLSNQHLLREFENKVVQKEIDTWKDWFLLKGYKAWVFNDFTTHTYYVGPEKISGCGDSISLDKFIKNILVEGLIINEEENSDIYVPIVYFYGYPSYRDQLYKKYLEVTNE